MNKILHLQQTAKDNMSACLEVQCSRSLQCMLISSIVRPQHTKAGAPQKGYENLQIRSELGGTLLHPLFPPSFDDLIDEIFDSFLQITVPISLLFIFPSNVLASTVVVVVIILILIITVRVDALIRITGVLISTTTATAITIMLAPALNSITSISLLSVKRDDANACFILAWIMAHQEDRNNDHVEDRKHEERTRR